jgi:SAM-dependent methyltransferase
MLGEGIRSCQTTTITWRLLQPFWSRLPFEPDTFDAIVASSVLEYVHSVDHVLAECRRTLKPGGSLIFTAPNPRHYVRRVEAVFRPAAVGALRLRVFELIPRMAGYLSYLKSSRHRMSAAGWKQAAATGGLVAREDWIEPDSALMLIRVAKPPAAQD